MSVWALTQTMTMTLHALPGTCRGGV